MCTMISCVCVLPVTCPVFTAIIIHSNSNAFMNREQSSDNDVTVCCGFIGAFCTRKVM